jgi:antitoxin component YwqK of YwqJK toxin-antitoxin module
MKPKFVIRLLAVMVVFYSCQDSMAQKNDWEKEGLKGKVKMVKEVKYNTNDTLIKVQKEEMVFNEEITYNETGNIIEDTTYQFGLLGCKNVFKYDNNGNRIEKNFYVANDKLMSRAIYKYDSIWNCIERAEYNSDSSLGTKITFKYDDKGNIVEELHYKSDGRPDSKFIYKFDDKRNKIEEYFYKSDGSLNNKTTFKYDDKGNYFESKKYKHNGKLDFKAKYKYVYDAYGNWIKRIGMKDGRKTFYWVTEREIIYY